MSNSPVEPNSILSLPVSRQVIFEKALSDKELFYLKSENELLNLLDGSEIFYESWQKMKSVLFFKNRKKLFEINSLMEKKGTEFIDTSTLFNIHFNRCSYDFRVNFFQKYFGINK